MLKKITDMLQRKDSKQIIIKFLNEITSLNIKDIIFNGVERFKSIAEYDFFLINLIGVTTSNKEEELFIKIIKKGKIKESLFCICDLYYEKYFNKNSYSNDDIKRPKKTTIEEKENTKHINKVFVNLFEDNIKKEKFNLEINFVEISKIIEQSRDKKINKKEWEECIEINLKDIILVGVKK